MMKQIQKECLIFEDNLKIYLNFVINFKNHSTII